MADNYIERQYEQYEARKAAWEKARKYGKKKTGITHPARTEQPGQTTTIIIKEYLLREKPIELVKPL